MDNSSELFLCLSVVLLGSNVLSDFCSVLDISLGGKRWLGTGFLFNKIMLKYKMEVKAVKLKYNVKC